MTNRLFHRRDNLAALCPALHIRSEPEPSLQKDLNDILVFSAVVAHNGFSAAARAIGQPKSSISQRIERLERRLGARLLERTTRRVRLTEVGALYHERCRILLAELDAAERDVSLQRDDPVGVIRVSCPTGIAQHVIAGVLPGFMALYPAVRVKLVASNQAFDLMEDRIDVAIRARPELRDETVVVRKLGVSRLVVVAGPGFARADGGVVGPDDLVRLPFLSSQEDADAPSWTLRGPDGAVKTIVFQPVLWTSDITVLVEAAAAGLGVALLPLEVVGPLIEAARLVRLMPEWRSDEVTVHLVYPSRRGLRPAARVFIDYLVEQVGRSAWWRDTEMAT